MSQFAHDREARSLPGSDRQAVSGLLVVCTAMLLLGLDNSILNVALVSLQRDPTLEAGTTDLQWITDAYPLALAGLVLACGRLGDRFGRRRTFLLGTGVCALASAYGALGDTPGDLIAARAGMGVGAAFLMPATLSLTTDLFRGRRGARKALAAWTASASIGLVLGPALGGWLLEHFSWRAGFWVNVPICAGLLLAARPTLPATRDSRGRRIDLLSTVLGIVTLTVFVHSVISAPHRGWTNLYTLAELGSAACVGALYARRERRLPAPSLPLNLLRQRRYAGSVTVLVLLFFGLAGMGFVIALHLQGVLGYTPLEAGVRLLPCAGGAVAGSVFSLVLGGRTVAAAIGAGLAAVGYLILATGWAQTGYGPVLAALVLVGCGVGMAAVPCTEIVMGAAGPDDTGTAAAMNDTTRAVGSSLGIAVLGSVVNTVYSDRMTGYGAALSQSPGKALIPQRAGSLPPGDLAATVGAARDSFAHAVAVASWPAAAGSVVAACAAWFLICRRPVTWRTASPSPLHAEPEGSAL
ncbi:MFS transporter [Streptomyces acidiscabies]|uniref:MFS transporter n=1 Tax=Streptomyces acidiscabies TaxID=42234 RepID=UPI00117F312A|nr:MFS transporter [Streptomyces acidiscabies]